MIVAVSLHNLAPDTVDFCDQKTQLDIFLDKKTFFDILLLIGRKPNQADVENVGTDYQKLLEISDFL